MSTRAIWKFNVCLMSFWLVFQPNPWWRAFDLAGLAVSVMVLVWTADAGEP